MMASSDRTDTMSDFTATMSDFTPMSRGEITLSAADCTHDGFGLELIESGGFEVACSAKGIEGRSAHVELRSGVPILW